MPSVPKRAVGLFALLLAACAGSAPQPEAAPDGAGSALCKRGPAADGDVDPSAGTWRVLHAPHGVGEFGLPLNVDAVLDACDSLVSIAHDVGPGGKTPVFGPGKLLWSKDGSAWQPRDMANDGFFLDIARGAGAWVAVGTRMGKGVISVSTAPDASSWREVFEHDDRFLSVAFGGGTFVAVTQRGVAFSEGGERWSWAAIPSVQSLYFEVAHGAGRFVVAGVGATLTSADGQRWEEVNCGPGGCPVIQTPSGPAGTRIGLQTMTFIAGHFYAFGASGNLRSADGVTFLPYTGERMPAAAIGGKLLSVGRLQDPSEALPLSMSADDGRTWTPLPIEAIVERADCVADVCLEVGSTLLVFQPAR